MFKKHDLFKILGIAVLFTALLTWIIPVSQFSGNGMVVGEISRTGIADLFGSGVYSLSTVLYQIVFLFVLGGLYGILSTIPAYKGLVETIVKKLKGKEIPFILITSFVFAGLASITADIYELLIFVPFFITIILNLKMDKFTALSTTFGSILIGRLGATYSTYAYNYLNSAFGLEFNTEIITKVAIFVLTYVLFNFFNYLHTKKSLDTKKKNNDTDKFEIVAEEKKSKKVKQKVWPLIVVFGVICLFQILGYVAWDTAFKIPVFTNFHNWLIGVKIAKHPIFLYLLGNQNVGIAKAFGAWDLFNITIILLIAILVIKLVYGIKFDELFEKFINGAKKMSRIAFIVVLIYSVFVITVWNPFIPTIVDFIVGLTKHFNIYLASIATLIASIFNVDMDYVAYSLGMYFASAAGSHASLMAIIVNAMHGFAGFFAPTSAILMIGLAYLNIPYKDWMKYIWRFLAGLFVGLLIIFTIVRYM